MFTKCVWVRVRGSVIRFTQLADIPVSLSKHVIQPPHGTVGHLFTFLYVSRSDIKTTQCKTVTFEYIRFAWRKNVYDWTDFDQVCSHKEQHLKSTKCADKNVQLGLLQFHSLVNVSADLFSCNRPRIWHLSIFLRYYILSKTHILHVAFIQGLVIWDSRCVRKQLKKYRYGHKVLLWRTDLVFGFGSPEAHTIPTLFHFSISIISVCFLFRIITLPPEPSCRTRTCRVNF